MGQKTKSQFAYHVINLSPTAAPPAISKWPLCSTDACQNNPNHEPICNVLAKQSVQFDGTLNAYLALEVLNGLLLRKNIHMKDQWAKILSFESHRKERNGTQAGRQITEYVLNFIRACEIGIEDEDLIDHVLGVFAINTYWKHGPDVNVSVLSPIGSLLTHSCDPNTTWDILFLENPGSAIATVKLCVEATKTIEIGQLITTTYLSRSLGQEVKVRREQLKKVFYFDCQCELCLEELELEKIQ